MPVIIDQSLLGQFLIKRSNETFRLLEGVSIEAFEEDGMLERRGVEKNVIDILGSIQTAGAGFAAVHATGLKTKVTVGADATLIADIGILHTGDKARIVYAGQDMDADSAGIRTTGTDARINLLLGGAVESEGTGIDMRGAGGLSTLITAGNIRGAVGVHIGGAAEVTNTGIITGDSLGVAIQTGARQQSSLVNSGIISVVVDDTIAVRMGAGRDEIVNAGIVQGKVLLGGGADRYESDGIEDLVVGGKGNDLYVGGASLAILELAGGGRDEFRSSGNTIIPNFVEILRLTGSEDVYAIGTTANETLIGNIGQNVLSGQPGADILTGKGAADEFRFSDGFDKDVITDFKPNVDKINISNWTAIESFDDLIDNHVTKHGHDLVFKAAGGDSLTLQNIKFSQIDEDDFVI